MADSLSPLNHAAYLGHYDICKMIIDKIEGKNPLGKGYTLTLLNYAIKFANHQIAYYIRSKAYGSRPVP